MIKKVFKTDKPIIGMVDLKFAKAVPPHLISNFPGVRSSTLPSVSSSVPRLTESYHNNLFALEVAGYDALTIMLRNADGICACSRDSLSTGMFISNFLEELSICEAVGRIKGNAASLAVGVGLKGDYKLAYILAGVNNLRFVLVDLCADETTIIPDNLGYVPYKKVKINVKEELGLWKRAFKNVPLFVKVDRDCFKDFKDKNLEEDFWKACADKAACYGADALILEEEKDAAPSMRTLEIAKKSSSEMLLFVASGVTLENALQILSVADGAFVGEFIRAESPVGKWENLRKLTESIRKFRGTPEPGSVVSCDY